MLNRRTFLVQSIEAAAAAWWLQNAPEQSGPLVKTEDGVLHGSAADGVHIFRGVPFAQPPTGPLRFRAPVPAQPWTGVRDATHFAAAAVQPDDLSVPQSEDCLYLNLWAPQDGGPHPVFVWIHGGGFTGGRSFDPLFDGTGFAKQGVLCVTIAYRLGVFGFLDLGEELGPEYAGGANNAMRDIVLALSWVQRNIAAFGGDPQRVTVGGESAGAKLTDMLMGVPSAEPLFQQMISESGGAERIWTAPQAAEIARGFCKTWTAGTGKGPRQLRDAPAREIIGAQGRFIAEWPVHFPLRCEIDGTLMPRAPLDTIRLGATRRKRLLLGTNRDESAMFLGPHPNKDPGAKDLGNLGVKQFSVVEQRYREIYPAMSDELRRIRSTTAEEYWVPSIRVADAHVSAGGTAFVYRFDFTQPDGRWAGYAFHSYELRFVWDHFLQESPSPQMLELAQTMHAAWTSFLRGQPPQAPGLPAWPPYSLAQRPTMLLDVHSHVEDAPQLKELNAWSGLLMQ